MKPSLSPASRRSAVARPAALRSRVTNGRALFAEGGDGRGAWARRLRDVFDAHVADLGGADVISEAERSILRRASTLTVELERIEARFAVGEGTSDDLDLYQRTAGNLRRLLESVGLERRQRHMEDLSAYIARSYREPSEEGARAEADPATFRPDPTEKASEMGGDPAEAEPATEGAAEETLAGALPNPTAESSP